jgi:UDPglucose 6-dehydrogenase
MDVDKAKVTQLRKGKVPFYEPGLEELVQRQLSAGALSFTHDLPSAVRNTQIVFVSVGTPSAEDGSVDLCALFEVAEGIGKAMEEYLVIVVKSTVPVGTAGQVRSLVARYAQGDFAVLSNPEFLREGQGIQDFVHPDRVIIGGSDDRAITLLYQVYAPFVPLDRILVMDAHSAEMAKYAANAFLATRISFINEVATLCEELGADIEQVRRAIGMDPRIGQAYFSPGLGYGGSCLPKDLRAMLAMGRERNVDLELLSATQRVNSYQLLRLFRRISDHFEGAVAGRRITVWGLTFKGGTDDLRESPSVSLIRMLVSAGSRVTAYDPTANGVARATLGDEVLLISDQYASIRGTEALVVATDWEKFREADLALVASQMRAPVMFDGRNIYDPAVMEKLGFIYYGVGRHTSRSIL